MNDDQISSEIAKRRSPWLAALLSILCPGLGHLYATEMKRAKWFFGIGMACLPIFWGMPFLPPSLPTVLAFYAVGTFAVVFLVVMTVDSVRCAKRLSPAVLTKHNRWPVYLGLFILVSLFEQIPVLVPGSLNWKQWETYSIPSSSMIPSLWIGDRLFALDRYYEANEPLAGDIAVFRRMDGTIYVKRIVGLPGQHVQMIQGILHIDGQAVVRKRVADFIALPQQRHPQFIETLPNGKAYSILQYREDDAVSNTQEFLVPEGHYFVLGDNRNSSMDSRYNVVGFIARGELIGKIELVFWSSTFNRIGLAPD
jgi:signal peptidase I